MERKRRREEGGDSRAVSSKNRAATVHADKEEYSTTKSSSNIRADDGGFKVPRPRQVLTVKHLREERSRLLDEHFGYSNTNNPFGDRMLAEPFVWKKKNQLLQAAGQKSKTTVAALLQSSKSKVQEIENVKRRREEREKEEELLQQQREEVQREREQEHYADYAAKEEVFHRLMHLKKTEIRLEQNRAEPIDLVVKGLRILKGEKFEKYETLPCPPHEIFEHYHDEPMNERTLEQLVSDVKLHVDVEATVVDRDFQLFWKSFLLLCTDALERARKKQQVMDSLSTNSTPQAAAAAAARLAAAVATPLRDAESGIVLSVASDVEQLLSSKTIEEIDELQRQIQNKLEQEEDIDVCYWEAIAQKIPFYKARAVCLQTWQQMVMRAAEMMREAAQQKAMEEAAAEKEKLEQTLLERGLDSAEQLENLLLEETEAKRLAKIQQIKETAFKMARAVEKTVNSNADGSYSPELEPYGEEDVPPPLRGPHSPPLWPYEEFKNCEILSQEEDEERRNTLRALLVQKERRKRLGLGEITASGADGPVLDDDAVFGALAVEEENEQQQHKAKKPEADQQQQMQLLGLTSPLAPVVPASAPGAALLLDPAAKITTYEEFVRKERKNLAPDEEVMSSSAEQRLSLHYSWEEKYRPRKPRFFNRVRTGYSWSKYNTTHYDHDNPPPKVVQGYKFNIFYPDLIDKRKTPTWFLEPSDTPDTVIIRFHAGPPYEDVAFKILNQEWQLERTRGFRNAFDRGIMQLYFSFKRYIYRR